MTGREIASRRRGVYLVSDLEVARLLNLPAGQTVSALSIDWQSASLLILVEGQGLPEVYEGASAPYLNKYGRLRSLADWAAADVSKLAAGAAHATVLAELGAVRFEDPDARAGRSRILERHAPNPTWTAWPACSNCVGEIGGDPYEWPCDDYLDAAAGLVTGLPGQTQRDEVTARDTIAGAVAALSATAADLALLSDPATGAKLDALVLGDQARPDQEV